VRVAVSRCLAALIAVLAASTVRAHEGDMGPHGPPPEMDDTERGMRQLTSLTGEFSAHLREVQKRLKLQAAQQPVWDDFAARAEALMQDQMRGMPASPENEDALHQINRRVDVVRNRLAAMEDVADAAKRLYASLTAEQRKLADELLPTAVPTLYSGLPSPQPLSRKRQRGE
jgi:Spy/CpxP family protein refolding chaperone